MEEFINFETFIEQTKHSDPRIRKKALKEMCPCRVKKEIDQIWERVFEMYTDPDSTVRYQVMHTLCDGSPKERESEVISVLEKMWNDKDEKLRRNVRRALNSYRRCGKWNVL
jgi:vesicle coat complex subunit